MFRARAPPLSSMGRGDRIIKRNRNKFLLDRSERVRDDRLEWKRILSFLRRRRTARGDNVTRTGVDRYVIVTCARENRSGRGLVQSIVPASARYLSLRSCLTTIQLLSFVVEAHNGYFRFVFTAPRYILHILHRPITLVRIAVSRSLHGENNNNNNLRKTDCWNAFSKSLDDSIRRIDPTVSDHERFVGTVKGTAKRYIPRGYRREYVPRWDEEYLSIK